MFQGLLHILHVVLETVHIVLDSIYILLEIVHIVLETVHIVLEIVRELIYLIADGIQSLSQGRSKPWGDISSESCCWLGSKWVSQKTSLTMCSCRRDKLVLVQSYFIDIIVCRLALIYNWCMTRSSYIYLKERKDSLRAFKRSLVNWRAFLISTGSGGLVGLRGRFTKLWLLALSTGRMIGSAMVVREMETI